MDTPPFIEKPPQDTTITSYDERHLLTYLRLLDAAAEGAQWEEVVRVIFGLDPIRDRDRARRMYDAHLARAEWMTENGYWELLNSARH